MTGTLDDALTTLVMLAVILLLVLSGKAIFARFNPGFNLSEELVVKDNPCVALMLGGYLLGILLVMRGVLAGPSGGIVADISDQLVYGAVGIILLNISQIINDRLILTRFRIKDEVIRDRNLGVAAVLFGTFVATGFVIGGALSGEGGGIPTALAFWALGQGALIVTVRLYSLMVPYDLHKELEQDNAAVGIALGGAIIGVGVLIGAAVSGDFRGWGPNLAAFVEYALIGLLLLPLTRFAVDRLLLPGVSLAHELVGQEHPNTGAAFLEGISYCVAAFLVAGTIP